jgi:Cupin domain
VPRRAVLVKTRPSVIKGAAQVTYYILGGEITFLLGDEVLVARQGDFLMVPRDTRHAFRVDSETAHFLNASLEAAVTELAMPAQGRVLPPKGLSPMPRMTPEQLHRYGTDVIPGPDPLRPNGH